MGLTILCMHVFQRILDIIADDYIIFQGGKGQTWPLHIFTYAIQ